MVAGGPCPLPKAVLPSWVCKTKLWILLMCVCMFSLRSRLRWGSLLYMVVFQVSCMQVWWLFAIEIHTPSECPTTTCICLCPTQVQSQVLLKSVVAQQSILVLTCSVGLRLIYFVHPKPMLSFSRRAFPIVSFGNRVSTVVWGHLLLVFPSVFGSMVFPLGGVVFSWPQVT